MAKHPPDPAVLFQPTGRPPLGVSISLALQHLVAMIVGCVTPTIIVADYAGMSPGQQAALIQSSLVFSAVTALLQLFPFGRGGRFQFGSGLPVMFGTGFAYLSSLQAIISGGGGMDAIAGGLVAGGLVAVIVGLAVEKIRMLFPPVVAGTVVFTFGLSLYPIAINYMAGGASYTAAYIEESGLTPALLYGSWQNWAIALLTLVIVVALNTWGRGCCRLASILIAMALGYAVAAACGMVSFSGVSEAAWFSLPEFLPYGIRFDGAACITIGVLFAITAIQAIGDYTAATAGAMDREPTNRELKGGIIAFGAANILTALFGGLPTATFSQNVGIVTTSKVINRNVLALAAAFLLLAGVSPKFAAVLTTIPQCVLGGATITVFSSITMTGIKLIASQKLTGRNATIVGLAAALGVGISQTSAALGQLPAEAANVLGGSPVVIATVTAVLLNLLLPKDAA